MMDDAERACEVALCDYQRKFGEQHPHTLWAKGCLGDLRLKNGDIHSAGPLLEEALSGWQHLDTCNNQWLPTATTDEMFRTGPVDPGIIAQAMGRVMQLRRCQGDTVGSLSLAMKALELKTSENSDKWTGPLRNWFSNSLAPAAVKGEAAANEAIREESTTDGSLDCYIAQIDEKLSTSRYTKGDEHPDTLALVQQVGVMRMNRDDLDGAEILLEEALTGWRRTKGVDYPPTLITMARLGTVQYTKGNLQSADLLCDEALTGMRRVLGDNHNETRGTLELLLAVRRQTLHGRPSLHEIADFLNGIPMHKFS